MSATHGWWCNTITYPTKCRGCGEPVFYRSIGTPVSVSLYSVSVPGTGTFWVCREFEAIG